MKHSYDIIIFGGGIAGLFVANRLSRAGYNLILIEKDKLGGTQTLASQGMIHGGQKYAIHGKATGHADSIAAMPQRWEDCFAGKGDVDLSRVNFLSDDQIMFSAGGILSRLASFMAARAVRGRVRKIKDICHPLSRGPAYLMQERVMESKSLISALAQNLKGRIFKGEVTELSPEGKTTVSGIHLKAKIIIFAAGAGNETALKLLKVKEQHTQRRPLRQIMVRPMDEALYGHGITGSPKPRVTITSHPDKKGGYVWYLGGNVAEKGAKMTEDESLAFAKKEMKEIFPHIDWDKKEWASLEVDRAEPFDAAGHLPPGPYVQQIGKILIAWPTKMTFAPALADKIMEHIKIQPSSETAPPSLPIAEMGDYPWEEAAWRKL